MTETVFEITRTAHFDAAHSLPDGPRPEYRRLHGHSFRVEASVRGEATGPIGWVADLGDLDAALRAAADDLDHCLLNEKPGLELPTLEALCVHFAQVLTLQFPGLSKVVVSRPTVGESCELKLS